MTAEPTGPAVSAHGLGWPDEGDPHDPATSESSGVPGTGLGWPTVADGLHPEAEEGNR